jgi:fatty-acyl-CoA synthase
MDGSSSPVSSWIASHARRAPSRIALEDLAHERTFTYAELDARIVALAGHLLGLGVERGDRIALLARNSHHALELQDACARLGALFVPLNWRLTEAELRAAGEDCAPRALLHESFLADKARAVAAALSIPSLGWDSDGRGAPAAAPDADDAYERALTASSGSAAKLLAGRAPARASDPWTIIYTSGTTGTPKGVVLSHASAAATMLGVISSARVHTDAISLTVLPFCHVAGLNLFTNPTLFMGGRVVIMRELDPARTLELLTGRHPRLSQRVTHLCGVPAVFQFIAALPAWKETRLEGVTTLVGGAPVPEVLTREWAAHGSAPQTVYGISEAGAAVLVVPYGAEMERIGSVGLPLQHVLARVVDSEGRELPAGEVGELLIGGASVTPGYWGKPALTAEAVDQAGWLHTGDAAVAQPDGSFRLVDRYKDLYISGGENVYPAEVENVLYQHEAVAEVAVIGVPDERWGEVGHAYVVARSGHEIDGDALCAFVRERIAAFKVPRAVTRVDALPRNNVGKILKRELRARHARGWDRMPRT